MTLPNDNLRDQQKLEDDKIARCLRTDEGKVLVERLLSRKYQAQYQLGSYKEPVDIYRAQGHLDEIEYILRLREEK